MLKTFVIPSGSNPFWCTHANGDTELVDVPCFLDSGSSCPVSDGSSIPFSIDVSGETPNRFQSVHLLAPHLFVVSHSVTVSGTERNAVFIYGTDGTYYSKHVFSDLTFAGQSIHPISERVFIVNRNKTLYFLKASSDYRSLTLENNFNVAGSINGVAVGALSRNVGPTFFIINHPVENVFGLFYSWRPAGRHDAGGGPHGSGSSGNPVKFKYFIFEYSSSVSSIEDMLLGMYPTDNTYYFVLPYYGGAEVGGNRGITLDTRNHWGPTELWYTLRNIRKAVGMCSTFRSNSTLGSGDFTLDKLPVHGASWGANSYIGTNKHDENLFAVKMSHSHNYRNTYHLVFYDIDTVTQITKRSFTWNSTNDIYHTNRIMNSPNTDEIILSRTVNQDLVYYKAHKDDSNLSTIDKNTIEGTGFNIKDYMFNDPYLMIFYESDTPGTYTIKYIMP